MDKLDALMIRTLLAPRPHRGLAGFVLALASAIAACEVRTMGMGLHRSDGRNAGIADPILVQAQQILEVLLPVL